MTVDKYLMIKRLALGFGASTEFWWTDRKQGGRTYHIIHIGLTDITKAKLLTITLLWITFRIGWKSQTENIHVSG